MTLPYEIVILDVGGANIVYPWMRAGQADPELVGGISRAYAGNQYSSIAAEFDVIPLVSQHRTSAEYGAVKTLFAKGAQIPCQGGAAGNVFEPRTGIITCSGKVTGEMEPGVVGDDGQPLWTINLTLTEADNADTAPTELVSFILTGALSPDAGGDPKVYVTTPDGTYPGDGPAQIDTFDGVTLTGALQLSSVPEVSWLSVELTDGWLVGTPVINLSSNGPDGSMANPNSSQARIYLVRGGVDVAGPVVTNYAAGDFSGGTITLTGTTAIVWPVESGDRIRIEIWSRIKLVGVDSGDRQTIFWGKGVFATENAFKLTIGGPVAAL